MRDRPEAIGRGVLAGQHRDHARYLHGAGAVDAPEACVGVRRAHHARVGLARQVEVVAVATLAGDEAQVFPSPNRLAETLGGGAGAGVQERHAGSSRGGVRMRSVLCFMRGSPSAPSIIPVVTTLERADAAERAMIEELDRIVVKSVIYSSGEREPRGPVPRPPAPGQCYMMGDDPRLPWIAARPT